MSTTYGQVRLTFEVFTNEVKAQLKQIGISYSVQTARKLLNKGYNVSDAVSYFINHSK